MRRILFTILASTALSVAVPAAALAHNGHHHHKRHHHARVRHLKFIGHRQASDVTSGTPAGTPADTSQPTAGTVTSFDGTTLVITLANGNTVSGDVTNDTEVKCDNSAMQSGDNDGDDNSGGVEQGDAVFNHSDGGGDNGGQGDQGDQSGDNGNAQTCTIAPGMAVTKAELTIDGSSAVWNEVELVSSSTTAPTSTTSSSGSQS